MYSSWSEVRDKGRQADPRDASGQAAGKTAAREHREAYVRGHQLAEMRSTAGVTQAELADALGVSQARISKIEHGEISGIDIVRLCSSARRERRRGRTTGRPHLEGCLREAEADADEGRPPARRRTWRPLAPQQELDSCAERPSFPDRRV